MQTSCKTTLSQLKTSPAIAVRLVNIEQVKALVPGYYLMDDLVHFYSFVENHVEYISGYVHPVRGPELRFCHPQGKTIIEFEDLELE